MLLVLGPAEKRDAPSAQEIVAYASRYIDCYFKGKDCNGHDICQLRFVKLVINSTILNSFYLLEDCLKIECASKKLRKKEVREILVGMYHGCASKGIPKEFATGLLLMEYIVCKGIDILDE